MNDFSSSWRDFATFKDIQQHLKLYVRFAFSDQHLLEHEKESGECLRLEMSKSSMNLWSEILALEAANLWYSSKIEDKHHLCIFLTHPTRHPVRCLPLLQWIKTGWFSVSRSTCNASRITWSGILTKGSWKRRETSNLSSIHLI